MSFLAWLGVAFIVYLLWMALRTTGVGMPARDRLALRIERNLIGLESAAKEQAWEAASMFAARQDPLLAEYLRSEGASEEHLMEFLRARGLVRSVHDAGVTDRIANELLKRGLLR
jgi:hypothetical protein